MITLSFYGAAGMVTGSKYLLQVNNELVMIDCGMFQGNRETRQLNWSPQPYKPQHIKSVILTHAHIDHVGYLPRLFHFGFKGEVYASPPTVDICKINLLDAAHIQMEDAEYRNKKKLTRHPRALPLFDDKDVQRIEPKYRVVKFGQWKGAGKNIAFRFHYAGHILGAASVEIKATDGKISRTILFSGDIGRYGNPLTRPPAKPPETDYLVCESTYGGRLHEPADVHQALMDLIRDIVKSRGVLLIPAFAVGRTQQIIFLVDQLISSGLAPEIDIHIDSPMAVAATEIYRKYPEMHSIDISKIGDGDLFHGRRVHLHRTTEDSKALNRMKGPRIILSASGMMSAGRILHHMIVRLPDPKNILAIAGYQAEETLGRKIEDGERMVYIHKQPVEIKARVEHLNGLSGHADYHEILHWAESIRRNPAKVFITHGEKTQSEAMAMHFSEERGWNCHLPHLNEMVELT